MVVLVPRTAAQRSFLSRKGYAPRSNRPAPRRRLNKRMFRGKSSLARQIRAIISSNEETKFARETILDSTQSGYINFNSYCDSTADWYRCIPVINPGITSAQKIGKVFRPSRCKLHLNFKFDSADQYTRDIMVVLYVLTSKQQKSYANSGINNNMTAAYNAFLDPGDGVNDSAYNGNWLSSTYPINKDAFTLQKKKLIHLAKSSGVANGYAVVGQYDGSGRGQYSPNSKLSHRVTIPIKLPKKLLYDQSANTVPTNAAVWFGIGYYYRNGLPGDNNAGILQVDASTEMYYKDA